MNLAYSQLMTRYFSALVFFVLAGCGNDFYVRDSVTDGDTFYLAERAFVDDDPALQSWVAYTLMLSACKLDSGGDNPARISSYGCEFSARMLLVDTWEQKHKLDAEVEDEYLDTLLAVREAGFLDEYTVRYFGRKDWQVPIEVDVEDFRRWRRKNLPRHKPQTLITGSWNYAHGAPAL